MHSGTRLVRIGADVAAFLLAATCAGCDAPGVLLCPSCRRALEPHPQRRTTPQGRPVHAALSFEGVAARCIRRLKGDGDTLVARPLGAALASVLLPELTPMTWVIPVPTSRRAFRRRGYRVPDLLIRRAGADAQPILTVRSGVLDQRGLDAHAREDNVRGTMRCRRAGGGASAVIVDDVVTTGATVDEAARALELAGFQVVTAIALVATPRRDGFG